MRHSRCLLLSIAVVLSSCAAVAQTPAPTLQKLTLKQAENIAITNHPQIRAATFIAAAAKEVNTEVRSAYFPQVYGAATGVDTNPAGSRVGAGQLTSPHP